MTPLLKPAEVAALLQVSVRTLAQWRWMRTGPPYVVIGEGTRGHVRYEPTDLEAWVARHRQGSVPDKVVRPLYIEPPLRDRR